MTFQAASKPEKKIPTHCATRWNSSYGQARAILDNKFCVQQLCDVLANEGKLQMDYSEADWADTRAVVELLKLFPFLDKGISFPLQCFSVAGAAGGGNGAFKLLDTGVDLPLELHNVFGAHP